MKFYNNNSFTYINIKKESTCNVMRYCRYYFNGKCLFSGRKCSERETCKNYIHTNSQKQDKARFNKIEPKDLKVKAIGSSNGIDYSKPYSITIYKIYSHSEKKSEYFYISNKDYELESCKQIDVGNELALKIRKASLYKDFTCNGQKYRLEDVKKHLITKK